MLDQNISQNLEFCSRPRADLFVLVQLQFKHRRLDKVKTTSPGVRMHNTGLMVIGIHRQKPFHPL